MRATAPLILEPDTAAGRVHQPDPDGRPAAPFGPGTSTTLPWRAPTPPADGLANRRAPASLRRPPDLHGPTLPVAIRVALRAAHWLEEVESGRRPAARLGVLLLPGLAARWRLGARRPRPAGRFLSIGPVQLRRRQTAPSCNLVLLFEHAGRTLPLAMELLVHDGDWFVSDVSRPGMLPVPPLPRGWAAALDEFPSGGLSPGAPFDGPDCQPADHR